MGQRILAIRRPWLFRLLRALDGEHMRITIPEDALITDFHYEPLSQTLIMTVESDQWKYERATERDGEMITAHIVYGD